MVKYVELRCIWHEGQIPLADAVQNGNRWKCRSCYNSERHLQAHYKKTHKSHVWTSMTTEQRRKEIVQHNKTAQGQGQRREFVVSEATTVRDSMGAEARKQHMNRIQHLDKTHGLNFGLFSNQTKFAHWLMFHIATCQVREVWPRNLELDSASG